MLSLSKILLLVAVAAGVFFAFRLLRQRSRRPVAKPTAPKALEMRKCAVCGVFVGAGETACERPNCPAG